MDEFDTYPLINRELANEIKSLMPTFPRVNDSNKPVSMWTEKDRLRGYPEATAVVIFRTAGCSWYRFSSCSMCGYFNDISPNVSIDQLKKQIDSLAAFIGDIKVLKVFTSGSFLDPMEFPTEARNYFLEKISGKISKLLVESRTEYITRENLSEFKDSGIDTMIAIGLETANDDIMKNIINKGSTFRKYLNAAEVTSSLSMELRTYLLFKPLFLSEKNAIADILESISKVSGITDDVSVNPMNIQRNTLVEKYWKKGMYRPPRLWSIAKILLESRGNGCEVISYPTGGNSIRGAHNDAVDKKLLELIYTSSLEQNFEELEKYYGDTDHGNYGLYLDMEDKMPVQHESATMKNRLVSSDQTI